MIRTLVDGGINWNWYLCADFNEENKTCHIFYYDRWHKYEDRGSRHPKHENTNARIIEDNKRVVTGVELPLFSGTIYTVTNPANIFSYRDMTHYVSE